MISRLLRLSSRWQNAMIKWTNDVSASSYLRVVTLTTEHGMAPVSKCLVRESLNRKVLSNNADTSIFNRKPQLYTIIHTSRVTHASLLLQVGLLHVGLLHVGRHYYWRWDNIGPTYIHISYSKPNTLLFVLGQHLSNQVP